MSCAILLIFSLCLSASLAMQDTSECVQPPMECPNFNITFWLFTRECQNDPYQLFPSDVESLKAAPWVINAPVKILIHGYTGHKNFSPNTEIRPAYMNASNLNVISVDYHPIAKEPCYFQAAANTELVGKCTAQLIDELVDKLGFKVEKFHVIGFSLGAQTAGFVANYVKCGPLYRITGLDPAMPLFVTTDNDRKLDSTDAIFVDVLHTNALEKGKLETGGHIDFFANGGMSQPGCQATDEQTKSGCDHARAPAYYAESITTDVGFYGSRCYSWISYMIGWCDLDRPEDEILFGEYVPYNSSGFYFFSTNAASPYARGRGKNSKRK